MEKTKISLYQFFALMVMFAVSSPTVIGIGREAKQDIWLVIISSGIVGILIFYIISYLFKKYPDDTLFIIFEKVLGKYLGKFIASLYMLYFLFLSTLIFRDIGEFITMYILVDTPILLVHLVSSIAIAYAVYLGIETVVRTAEINFIFIEFIFLILIILVLSSNIVDLNNFLPILENGIKPLYTSFFKMIASFPFGELIIFLLILPKVENKEKVVRVGVYALITTTIIVLINTFINISVLGVYLYTNTPFPSIEAIRLIKFGTFFQRMDALIVTMYVLEILYKLTLYNWAVHVGFKEIFKVQKYNRLIIPTSILAAIGATLIYRNYTSFVQIGTKINPFYINFPFELIIPILMVIIIFIKNFLKKHKKSFKFKK